MGAAKRRSRKRPEATVADPSAAALRRAKQETAGAHRAMLLWILGGGSTEEEDGDLTRAIAVALGLGLTEVRNWRTRRAWRFRAVAGGAAFGGDVEVAAWSVYRRLYLPQCRAEEIVSIQMACDALGPRLPLLWQLDRPTLLAEIDARVREGAEFQARRYRVRDRAAADAQPLGRERMDELAARQAVERVKTEKRARLAGKRIVSGAAAALRADAAVLAGDEDALARSVAVALAEQAESSPLSRRTAGATGSLAAVEAEAAIAEAERRTGSTVAMTAADARNVLRALGVGALPVETDLRQADRDLLEAARAVGPDAEARLLTLLATSRAEAADAAGSWSDRLEKLVDASFGYFAQELKAGRVKVSMASLPMLIKAKMLLRGEATSRVEHTGLLDARRVPVGDSVRAADARRSGKPEALLAAMRQDVAELAVILDAVATSAERDDAIVVDVPTPAPDEGESAGRVEAVGA